MKVELILNNDTELRAYIKELIKNEIINISREEIQTTVKEVLNKRLETQKFYNQNTIDYLLAVTIDKQVATLLKQHYYDKNKEYLATYINNKIDKLLDKKLTELNVTITANIIKALNK